MPQLDKFTFVPQVFWLVVIFFLLYFVLVEYSLPKLFKILHFRKKKILDLNAGSTSFCQESYFFKQSTDSLMLQFVSKIRLMPEVLSKISEIEVSTSTSSLVETNTYLSRLFSSFTNYEVIKDSLDSTSLIKDKFQSGKSV